MKTEVLKGTAITTFVLATTVVVEHEIDCLTLTLCYKNAVQDPSMAQAMLWLVENIVVKIHSRPKVSLHRLVGKGSKPEQRQTHLLF